MPADGQISLAEFAKFKSLFGKTSKQKIEHIFSIWDRNENSKLDEGEFAIFYTHRVTEQAILMGLINPNQPNVLDILRS
jgi:Ca2+-binding EF-hand superfamily protein